ncbi:MAG: hypothetical protein DMF60_06765 [Acidobacteria bacterium]|nr:MAG: hypothetical protein DMF60_06765 [Acidobacteriota bacterium]
MVRVPRLVLKKALIVAGILTVSLGFAYHVAAHPMDFRVYHYGARGVFDGTRPVYGPASGLGWPMHYRYPPVFLLLFAPFAALPLGLAAALWVVLKVATLVLLLRLMSSPNSPPKLGGVAAPLRKCREATFEGAAGVVSWGTTPPFAKKRANGTPPNLGGELVIPFLFIAPYILEEFRYGNAQFFVLALTIWALLTARERPVLAAGSLALAISIKVWPLFFVPYLAVRRDWKVVSYTLGFVAVLALLPSLYFGLSGNFNLLGQWFTQESHTQLSENEIWFPNQSLRGVLMRYLTTIDYSQVPDSNYPQMNVAKIDPASVRLLWTILAGAIYAVFLFLAQRRRESDGWLDHGLAFCLVALLEPFTQKYALAVLLWPALAAAVCMKNPRLRILMYAATTLVLIQPLAPSASIQRLLQVLGLDFAAALLLTAALTIYTLSPLYCERDL